VKETGEPLKGREAERQTGMRLAGAAVAEGDELSRATTYSLSGSGLADPVRCVLRTRQGSIWALGWMYRSDQKRAA
jgi:hypothetical protein